MTPEAQRIALARFHHPEYATWTVEFTYTGEDDYTKDWVFTKPCKSYPLRTESVRLLDYLGSLDDIHEVEVLLTRAQLHEYGGYLNGVSANSVSSWSPENGEIAVTAMATAERRAEGVLRAIGKWDDTK